MHAPDRITALRRALKPGEGFLITNESNVRYLTGFTGSSGYALITKNAGLPATGFLITDFRYAEQSEDEVAGSGLEVFIQKKGMLHAVKRLVKKYGIGRLLVESSVSYGFYERLSSIKPRPGPKVVTGLVEKLRAVKDGVELGLIKEAIRRAEEAFLEVKPFIRAGATERGIALRLEAKIKKMGSRRLPFDIIVASGANSARPHASVTDKRLEAGDLVIVDWGAEAAGYFSDMTRTFLIRGRDMAKKKDIYRLALEASRMGFKSAKAGVAAGSIDRAARDVIEKGGYGESFGHSTGHGVGLEVHELPHVGGRSKERIRKNMVFTVEPGIYVPGLGGVRIEDMALAEEGRALMLTSLPRGLNVIA